MNTVAWAIELRGYRRIEQGTHYKCSTYPQGELSCSAQLAFTNPRIAQRKNIMVMKNYADAVKNNQTQRYNAGAVFLGDSYARPADRVNLFCHLTALFPDML